MKKPSEVVHAVAREISDALYKRRGLISITLEQQMTDWIFRLEALENKIAKLEASEKLESHPLKSESRTWEPYP